MLFGQAGRAVGLCVDMCFCCYAQLGDEGKKIKIKEKKRQSPLTRLIPSSRYCLPGPVYAADSSVGPIAAGGSTVHAVDSAVQHIGCCTD